MIDSLLTRNMRKALSVPRLIAVPLLLWLVTVCGCGGGSGMPESLTLKSIQITSTNRSVATGITQHFVATGTYTDNSSRNLTSAVTWASSDASIASISNAANSQGLATGLAVGSTQISAALGGVMSAGVVLTVTARVETVLHSFTGADGATPVAGLIQATDGNFYGTTYSGGTSNNGVIFRLTPGGFETLYSFAGGADGANPQAALIQATDGNFYGTTGSGGTSAGTVFRFTPAGVETVLHTFGALNDGGSPEGGVIQAADGNFYGTTLVGGPMNGYGTIFKVTPAGVETVLYSFTGGADGAFPQAGLVQATDGNFYGTTYGGGSGTGTVFEITPAGVEAVLHSFNGADGQLPQAGLIQAADGNFYGTIYIGFIGAPAGSVFRLAPTGLETLYAFAQSPDGANPQAGLIQAADGNFYGTTYQGGTSGYGTIFKLTPTGVETVLHSFTGGADGANPAASLVQASDGYLYGTTAQGGRNNVGTVFRF